MKAVRILVAICIAIVSLPIVYAVGSLAVVYGAYAIAGLVALVVQLVQGMPFQSVDDFLAFLGIAGLALAMLAICSAALYGIWHFARLMVSKLRTQRS